MYHPQSTVKIVSKFAGPSKRSILECYDFDLTQSSAKGEDEESSYCEHITKTMKNLLAILLVCKAVIFARTLKGNTCELDDHWEL